MEKNNLIKIVAPSSILLKKLFEKKNTDETKENFDNDNISIILTGILLPTFFAVLFAIYVSLYNGYGLLGMMFEVIVAFIFSPLYIIWHLSRILFIKYSSSSNSGQKYI